MQRLTSLIFEYGLVDGDMWKFGVNKGFGGNSRSLQLRKLEKLEKLTTHHKFLNLGVLLSLLLILPLKMSNLQHPLR